MFWKTHGVHSAGDVVVFLRATAGLRVLGAEQVLATSTAPAAFPCGGILWRDTVTGPISRAHSHLTEYRVPMQGCEHP